MKWPETLVLIRHGESAYNAFKKEKKKHPLYQEFLKSYKECFDSSRTRDLAQRVLNEVSLKMSDRRTPLTETGKLQAITTAKNLREKISLPDVVFVSPYDRTWDTLRHMYQGWSELEKVETYEDERIREQEHGLVTDSNDLKVFFALHPEQRGYFEKEGAYNYCFPQGENIPRVRERNLSWVNTVIREFVNRNVWAISHNVNISSIRANLERLSETQFLLLNKEKPPINCGVTIYKGDSMQGSDGKLVLSSYNQKLY